MIEFKKYIHHSQDLEMAILGACLLEKLAFGRTYGLIDRETFYFTGHQEVYSAMREMYNNSVPIDTYTVTEKIIGERGIENFHGYNVIYFVTNLTNTVVSSANLEYHCHLIKEMWRRRELVKIRASYPEDGGFDTRVGISKLNEEIAKIVGSTVRRDWYDMSELMYDLMQHQYEMAKGKKEFLTTGFEQIDKMNGGFYPGQMIVIGARPAVGKSALMGQMAIKMARRAKKVGIISLEMNNTEIAARLASIETDIDFGKVFRSIAHDEALHKVFYDKISKNTVNLPIFLSDKTKVNVSEIKAKAIKLKSSKGCDCLIIDYLQLIDGATDRNYNREQEVAKMSRGLKLMAQELNIPVIVLCQLNRAVTVRSYKDRFPKLSDLRESGAIEQDADVVMFLHRDFMSGYQVDDQERSTEFTADLLGPKWRNGSTFHLQLDFDPPKMKFTEQRGFAPVNIETNYQDDNPF